MGLFDAFRGGQAPGMYAPWMTYDPGAPQITPSQPMAPAGPLDTSPQSVTLPKGPNFWDRMGAADPNTGLSKWQQLQLMGATLRDDPSVAANMQNSMMEQGKLSLQQQMLRQQMAGRQALASAFGGGASQAASPAPRINGQPVPQAPTSGPTPAMVASSAQRSSVPTVRAMAPALGQAAAMGVDITDMVNLLDKAAPELGIADDGTVYDKRDPSLIGRKFGKPTAVNNQVLDFSDPSNINRAVPSAPVAGANAVYDNQGRIVDWSMPQGAQQALAASTAATEGTKAGINAALVAQNAYNQSRGTKAGEAPYTPIQTNVGGVPTTISAAQFAAGQGVNPAGQGAGGVPEGLQNNNPLNVRPLAKGAWAGQTGVSPSGFAQFATPEDGWNAAHQNLISYATQHGVNTIQGVVSRWAPKGDGNNDPAAYATTVAKALGVTPMTKLNLQDPKVRERLLTAMAAVETGQPVQPPGQSSAPQAAGIRGVNPNDKKRVEDLLKESDDLSRVAGLAQDFMSVNGKNATGPGYGKFNVPIPFMGSVNINPTHAIASAVNPDVAKMESITSRAAPLLRPTGSGRIMQNEYAKFLKAFPNVENLGPANAGIKDQLVNEAQTRRDYANFMSNWLTQHGSLDGADQAWQGRQRAPGAPAGGAGQAAPKVRVYNPRTGNLE